MKKTVFMLIACMAMMASCNNGKTTTAEAGDAATTDSVVYEGMTPAADCYGINYRLVMSQDSTMGFTMAQSYMKSETEADTTFNYQGVAVAATKTVDGKENNYLKFPIAENDTTYFLVLNDSTLRMVNSDLEEAVMQNGDMLYDLKLVK
jgi:hypothetical protein